MYHSVLSTLLFFLETLLKAQNFSSNLDQIKISWIGFGYFLEKKVTLNFLIFRLLSISIYVWKYT